MSWDDEKKGPEDEAAIELPPELIPEKEKCRHLICIRCPRCREILIGAEPEGPAPYRAVCGAVVTRLVENIKREKICPDCDAQLHKAVLEHYGPMP